MFTLSYDFTLIEVCTGYSLASVELTRFLFAFPSSTIWALCTWNCLLRIICRRLLWCLVYREDFMRLFFPRVTAHFSCRGCHRHTLSDANQFLIGWLTQQASGTICRVDLHSASPFALRVHLLASVDNTWSRHRVLFRTLSVTYERSRVASPFCLAHPPRLWNSVFLSRDTLLARSVDISQWAQIIRSHGGVG